MKNKRRIRLWVSLLSIGFCWILFLAPAAVFAQPKTGNDCTLCPSSWWPRLGNTVTFTARVYGRTGAGPCGVGIPGRIHFLLVSSREHGYSLNKGTRTAADLHFNTPENHAAFEMLSSITEECDLVNGDHEHWMHVRTRTCVTEATVTVKSEDFGSHGILQVWVEYSEESACPRPEEVMVTFFRPRETVDSPPTCVEGSFAIRIPRDDNGNGIADTWWGDATDGTSPTWDEETLPNSDAISRGDGLTRYEEWRGVHVQGSHTRLLTLTKELFIYRENAAWGAEDAAFAADIHFVTADEMNGALHDPAAGTVYAAKGRRIINFNRTSHTKVDQHGLWLAVGGGDGNWANWGLTYDNDATTDGPIGPPRANGRVEIYSDNIANACGVAAGPIFRYGFWLRGDAQFSYDGRGRRNEMIGDTIGHELGHGINLRHHRGDEVSVRHAPGWDANGWIDVNSRPETQTFSDSTAGEATCVMAYNYHQMWQSVALTYNLHSGRWLSSDPDWTPTVLTCVFGYGAGCTIAGGRPACRAAVTIDDSD